MRGSLPEFAARFRAEKAHRKLFRLLFHGMNRRRPYEILDAGSGRTSLSLILHTFPRSHVDAVVYPGDLRKINSIKAAVPTGRYRLMERDLCLDQTEQQYDIAVAHLLLGEAMRFGNPFALLLDAVLALRIERLAVIDFLEDPDVDFDVVLQHAQAYGYTVTRDHTTKKSKPHICKRFTGWHYRGLLLELQDE